MNSDEMERELRREFAEFIESVPASPNQDTEAAVLRRVSADLRLAPWRGYAKLTLFQVAAGLLTLTVCPQFGIGLDHHAKFLHDVHTMAPPLFFYLFCGMLYVSLGALAIGLVLKRDELRRIGSKGYGYSTTYAVFSYLALVTIGTEAFVFSSLAWMPGAILGNAVGFRLTNRLTQRFA